MSHVRKKVGKNGTPRYYVIVEKPRVNGKRVQKQEGGSFRTKAEAAAACAKIDHDIARGMYVEPSTQTVEEYLTGWLEAIRESVRPSTWEGYRSNLNLHVIPHVGQIQLRHLTPGHLGTLYQQLLAEGRANGPGGLSRTTVRQIHVILHRALGSAYKQGLIGRNVADHVDSPKTERKEMTAWSAEETKDFLDRARSDRLFPLYRLALLTGMRRSEIAALRWDRVDLERGTVTVVGGRVSVKHKVYETSPKTSKSRRAIALDKETVAALRAHRARQMEDRLRGGAEYEDQGYVFQEDDGSPLHPQKISRSFRALVPRLDLRPIRFHDLRHTLASVSLEAGVSLKVVSERLGHANIGITADTYTHVSDSVARDAAEAIAALL